MAKSTRVNTKPQKRPPVTGTLIGVRLQPDMLDALDAVIAKNQPTVTRPEAIRIALGEWLRSHGHMTAN